MSFPVSRAARAGRYAFGLAPLPPAAGREVAIFEPGARLGDHGIAVERAWARRSHWYSNEQDAKGSFVRNVAELRAAAREAVLIQRIERREIVEAVLYGRGIYGADLVALETR